MYPALGRPAGRGAPPEGGTTSVCGISARSFDLGLADDHSRHRIEGGGDVFVNREPASLGSAKGQGGTKPHSGTGVIGRPSGDAEDPVGHGEIGALNIPFFLKPTNFSIRKMRFDYEKKYPVRSIFCSIFSNFEQFKLEMLEKKSNYV